MGGSDRANRERPTLGARALMGQIEKIAEAERLIGYRVAYKMNDKGEHVVALIYQSYPPA
jgi:hypothetical protein